MAFLTLMLALMASRQTLTLVHDFRGWYLTMVEHQEELFGLIVSILSLVMVIFLQKIIRELKNKDLSLKEKEYSLDIYQSYFNAATSSIFIFNNNKKLININPAACAMQGYTREEMLAMDPIEYIHPDSHQIFHDFFSEIDREKVFHSNAKGIKKDGSIIHVEVAGVLVRVNNKNYYLASLKDVTEQYNAEKALRESEDRLKLVLEGSQDGHWDWDILEDTGWWSTRFYHLLGYEDGELTPTFESFCKSLHPDDKERMLQKSNEHLENKEPYDIEYRVLKKSGEYGWFRTRGQAQWDEQGKPVRMGGSIQDITEHIEAEKKIRNNEKRLRDILDSMFTFVGVFSLDGIVMEANRAPLELASLKREDVIGKQFTETYWWSYSTSVQDRLRKALNRAADGQMVRYDELIRIGEDQFITIDVTFGPLYDSNGNIFQLLGSAVDISDRKNIEKALTESEEKYRSIVETTTEWIWECDLDGNSTYSNNAIYSILGYSLDEIVSKNVFELMHPDSLEEIKAVFEQAKKNKSGWQGLVISWIHKDGSIRYLESNSLPIFDDSGQLVGYRGADRDISERIKAENELRFTQFAIDNLNDAAFWVDKNGQLIYVNEAACNSLGYSKDELLGMYVFDIDPNFEKNKWDGYWEKTKDQYFSAFETVHITKQGKVFPVEISSNHLTYMGKDYRCTFARDITERKLIEASMRASEERYRALYDNNPSMFFTIDKNLNVISVNNFGANQLGYKPHELVGHLVLDVFYEKDKTRALNYFKTCLAEPDRLHRWELRKVRKDGSMLWVRESAHVIQDDKKNPMIFIVCEDISETHLLSEQLSYQASHDSLTGLINRREFEIRLNRILDTTQTQETEHVLCYLDLDEFKVINDTCGHIAGDELLRDMCSVLQKRIRKRDTLARLGGDEFGILMEHCDMGHAKKVAASILKEIGNYRFTWDDRSFSMGVSIGLVPINQTISEYSEILRAADAACYVAKDAGRNRIHIYSDDDIDLARRHGEMQWVSRINKALEKNHFLLYAQPIVPIDNDKKKKKHYELLIRLQEGKKAEIIAPGAFLPAAERYNLATALDKWVVKTVFVILKDQPNILPKLEFFSINLSGKSLANDAFLEFIITELKQSPEIGDKICFEITETAVIANLTRATLFIRRLKELGCRFALDDFGSGLSSFAYLKTLPVDYLKIDGLFVKDIVDDETDYAMVKSINDIGQVMGIQTIAEFVENEEIKQKLIDIGVNYAQGYGIGKPKPLAEWFNGGNKQAKKKTSRPQATNKNKDASKKL